MTLPGFEPEFSSQLRACRASTRRPEKSPVIFPLRRDVSHEIPQRGEERATLSCA
jgi:hypothetical protein